jgi:hypothetical protein
MSRQARTDTSLDVLNQERDHIAIQISLLGDAAAPDEAGLAELRRKLSNVESRITQYRPGDT